MSAQIEHPNFEHLLQFVERQLPAVEAQRVVEHLAGCRDCAQTVERLQRIVRALESGMWRRPSAHRREAAIEAFRQARHIRRPPQAVVARLSFDSWTMGLSAGLRAAAGETHQLLYTTDAADIDLSISEAGEEARRVIGQVLPKDRSNLFGEAQVLLILGDKVVAQTTTTELGEFALDDVPAGNYTLVVLTPDMRLEVPGVAV